MIIMDSSKYNKIIHESTLRGRRTRRGEREEEGEKGKFLRVECQPINV